MFVWVQIPVAALQIKDGKISSIKETGRTVEPAKKISEMKKNEATK